MIAKKSAIKTKVKSASDNITRATGIDLYFKRIFALMFGAVGLTAVVAWFTIYGGGIRLLVGPGGMSGLYYIVIFGGLALSIWAQARAFHMKPATAAVVLAIYAGFMGFGMTPLIWGALAVNPASILQAFVISALMFASMALFGYKTVKNLSFIGTFLQFGMIGLILVAIFSIFWPLGSGFATIVSLIGVLIFALFTAYDMQFLKRAYVMIGNENQKNQLAVLGALHLYIAFIAMFQYILSLLNIGRR